MTTTKWKTTSKEKMEDDLKKTKMEDDLKKNKNGTRPQIYF